MFRHCNSNGQKTVSTVIRPIRIKTKKCTKCLETKQISDFGLHSTGVQGYNSICKDCKRKQNHEYYLKSQKQKSIIKNKILT